MKTQGKSKESIRKPKQNIMKPKQNLRKPKNPQARPKKRWTDDLHGYLTSLGVEQPWEEVAKDADTWADLEKGFSTWGLPVSGHLAITK